jgi:ABC-2 type transport system ATP-binding protein
LIRGAGGGHVFAARDEEVSMTAASTDGEAGGAAPLRIDGVVKRYGGLTAVDGVSLELRRGECLGLLGPNGAGKTTLIRAVAGRVTPDAGTVSILGAPAGSAAARAALGWVPQELALYPRLTCRQNLEAFGRFHGLSGAGLRDAVARCLEWAALADRAGDAVGRLSGGMKRRLNMAAGIIHAPRVVLMDEPTVGVDPQSRNRIFDMIEALGDQGISLVYTTHYMEEAERLCDRIAIVDHGRTIAAGTREELVRGAFGGRSEVLARFERMDGRAEAWTRERGGRFDGGAAHFAVDHPTDIAGLLDAAARAGHELVDVTLRKPNLESVFLHLTGRELRE